MQKKKKKKAVKKQEEPEIEIFQPVKRHINLSQDEMDDGWNVVSH